jgi:hypothetical protein
MNVAIQHIDKVDDNLWCSNLSIVHSRILKVLGDNEVVVIDNDILFGDWDENINNCQAVFVNYDDIIWDECWLDDLQNVGKKFNIKFTLITNVYFRGNDTNEYKVLFYKELFGVFYNSSIKQVPISVSKLFTCLIQRTTYPRLKTFSDLYHNNLLELGNVSLLGFQYDNLLSPNGVVEAINDDFGEFDDIVELFDFPFRNFVDLNNCFEVENQSKYIVVLETYNDFENSAWVSFTEKTFRSLQIPNISLLINKQGAVGILNEIGIKTHPVNRILDKMQSYNSQNNVLIGILESDMFGVDSDTAIHNQHKLKEWSDILNTDDFYQGIINNLL